MMTLEVRLSSLQSGILSATRLALATHEKRSYIPGWDHTGIILPHEVYARKGFELVEILERFHQNIVKADVTKFAASSDESDAKLTVKMRMNLMTRGGVRRSSLSISSYVSAIEFVLSLNFLNTSM